MRGRDGILLSHPVLPRTVHRTGCRLEMQNTTARIKHSALGQDSVSTSVRTRELTSTSFPACHRSLSRARGELRASVQTVVRGLSRPAPPSTPKTAATILNVAQCLRGGTEHRLQVPISAALSNTPCQLGPAGLHTSPQNPGLHLSARSASQRQQRTRVPLHTEETDSTT